jgi:hypothetical protein
MEEQIDSKQENDGDGSKRGTDSNMDEYSVAESDQDAGWANREDLKCRFYRNEWPEEGEIVVVSILVKSFLTKHSFLG